MKKRNIYRSLLYLAAVCALSTLVGTTSIAYDNFHFYRAPYFFYLPRLEREWLGSFDAIIGGGSTKKSFDARGKKINIQQHMQCCHDETLESSQQTFTITEASLSYIQNSKAGFFAQAHIPIRKITLREKETGIGDLSMYGGFTKSYLNTTDLDFIDYAIQIGILIPTARTSNIIMPSFSFGYNGHWAGLCNASSAIGLFEWLTIGGYGTLFIFSDAQQIIHNQKTTVHRDPLFHISAYIVADHFARGLSLTCAYSFTKQTGNLLAHSTIPDNAWQMSVFHFNAEYDFTKEDQCIGIRIGAGFNTIITGKRIFDTSMTTGTLGIDIVWH